MDKNFLSILIKAFIYMTSFNSISKITNNWATSLIFLLIWGIILAVWFPFYLTYINIKSYIHENK